MHLNPLFSWGWRGIVRAVFLFFPPPPPRLLPRLASRLTTSCWFCQISNRGLRKAIEDHCTVRNRPLAVRSSRGEAQQRGRA